MSGDSDGKPYDGFFRDRRARSHFWWMFLLYVLLFVSIVVPIVGNFWDARNRRNSLEKTAGTPSMNSEQYGRDDHRNERQVTVLIVPIRKNENNGKNNNSTKDGEDQATCACGDDLIQIRVSSGNVYQASVSGAVERKD